MNVEISASSASPAPSDVKPAAAHHHAASSTPSSERLVVIRPSNGWQPINAGELWRSRELLAFLVWRDVKVRYKQTALGAAWAVLQPLMMMVVFTIFFGRLAGVPAGDLPYPLFSYAGLLPWTFFATAIAAAGNSVVASERLITKVYFPRLAVPFAAVGAAVVDFVIAFGLLLVMMFWYGVAPGPGMLLTPLIFALIALGALGVGTLLGALSVAYRDFKYIIPFMIQLGMFATPTVYMQPKAGALGGVQALLALNPMTTLIGAFRASVLGGPIAWGPLALSAAAVVAAFVVGCLYFRKVEDSFADVI
jgi:lipopolysaccharide transport system permease protein